MKVRRVNKDGRVYYELRQGDKFIQHLGKSRAEYDGSFYPSISFRTGTKWHQFLNVKHPHNSYKSPIASRNIMLLNCLYIY